PILQEHFQARVFAHHFPGFFRILKEGRGGNLLFQLLKMLTLLVDQWSKVHKVQNGDGTWRAVTVSNQIARGYFDLPLPTIVLPYRRVNFSTRPAVSTNFCSPVKKGWQAAQMPILISRRVDRVRYVAPHAQTIVVS